MDKTYLIDEAASFIGISRRNFERMNISSREEFREAKDGKKRRVRVYDESELNRVKAERESSLVKPSLVKTTNDGMSDSSSQVVTRSDLKDFGRLLVEAINQGNQKLLAPMTEESKKKQIDISGFKDKLILNFAQALAYSGLPEGDLKSALKDKKILGKKTSENGTWKINRNSLDEFCKSYFE
jgi:hypothetical protein